jgi:hypothetical protein
VMDCELLLNGMRRTIVMKIDNIILHY